MLPVPPPMRVVLVILCCAPHAAGTCADADPSTMLCSLPSGGRRLESESRRLHSGTCAGAVAALGGPNDGTVPCYIWATPGNEYLANVCDATMLNAFAAIGSSAPEVCRRSAIQRALVPLTQPGDARRGTTRDTEARRQPTADGRTHHTSSPRHLIPYAERVLAGDRVQQGEGILPSDLRYL